MVLVIRAASPDDHDALVEQFQGLNVHEEQIARNRRTDRQGAEECLAFAWRRVQQTRGNAIVAEVDGRVAGHLFLLFQEDAVFVRQELRAYAYVSELFVREENRGAGIATALMNEAERLAVARGVGRIMVGVLAGNGAAEALYDQLGFAAHAIELAKDLSLPGRSPA
jgi:GNAT superfamily N-acetyltransferase